MTVITATRPVYYVSMLVDHCDKVLELANCEEISFAFSSSVMVAVWFALILWCGFPRIVSGVDGLESSSTGIH